MTSLLVLMAVWNSITARLDLLPAVPANVDSAGQVSVTLFPNDGPEIPFTTDVASVRRSLGTPITLGRIGRTIGFTKALGFGDGGYGYVLAWKGRSDGGLVIVATDGLPAAIYEWTIGRFPLRDREFERVVVDWFAKVVKTNGVAP